MDKICFICGFNEDTLQPEEKLCNHYDNCDELNRLRVVDGPFKDIRFDDTFIMRNDGYVKFTERSWCYDVNKRKKYSEAKSIFDLGELWHMTTGYIENWDIDGKYHEGYMDSKGSGPNYDIITKLELTTEEEELINFFYDFSTISPSKVATVRRFIELGKYSK